MRKLLITAAVSLGIILIAWSTCFHPSSQSTSHVPALMFVRADNRLAFRLLGESLDRTPQTNTAFSTIGISCGLAVLHSGAHGTTKEAIGTVLGSKGLDVEQLGRSSAQLLSTLKHGNGQTELHIANSLWLNRGTDPSQEFVHASEHYHDTQVFVANLALPRASSAVSAWVRSNTKGRIRGVGNNLTGTEAALLVNATYFKAPWAREFAKSNTRLRLFHRLDGSTKRHPTMHQSGEYAYYEHTEGNARFQLIEVPYADKSSSMYVFLPAVSSNLQTMCGTLADKDWGYWTAKLHREKVGIYLPRFTMQQEMDLRRILTALGMGIAFDARNADFRSVSTDPSKGAIWLTDIKHASYICVDEEGTEAAAGTYSLFGARAAPRRFAADRPFLFVIAHKRTGAILLAGCIVDPQ